MNSNLVLLIALSVLVALECAQSRPTEQAQQGGPLAKANPEDVHSVTSKTLANVPEQKKIASKLSQPQDAGSVSGANNVSNDVSDKAAENSTKLETASAIIHPDIPNKRQGRCFGYKGMC